MATTTADNNYPVNGQANGSAGAASDVVEGGAIMSTGGMTSEKKGTLSNVNTPHSTAADVGANKNNKAKQSSAALANPSFGGATVAKTSGAFPALGSTLGPYFAVGRLGKGTFCSIHKCINMHYHHEPSDDVPFSGKDKPKVRLAAAKVEIGEFKNSGVLGGEATMLQYLDSALPALTVPVYMGHFRAGEEISAILMEYLPGQDMHWIRDWATKYKSRRIAVGDAVYLTADIMLPLLERMHEVGIVHRDVKPSNCVKRGRKDFCMVDFGLSKSIVVPGDSSVSDPDHPWDGKDWLRPPSHSGAGHFRKERPTADFRGTSMYASVRVHQLKDYCPRDDMWSLLYVFCDLVSGGLPWMSHAANRDRTSCQKLKERIHGEEDGTPDQTERLLRGHEYHMALFKKFKGGIDPPEGVAEDDGTLPEPLALSKDEKKVALLRKAFQHLAGMSFSDRPDYKLIKECLVGFLEGETPEPENAKSVSPIDWDLLAEHTSEKAIAKPLLGGDIPLWDFEGDEDPVDSSLFQEAEADTTGESEIKLSGAEADLARLPLELRYRIAQMEYNALNHLTIPPHLALRDWMKAALPIVYGEWDSKKFERGGHRSSDDGYRRELYLKLIDNCLKCAEKFQNFRSTECIYVDDYPTNGENGVIRTKKRQKVSTSIDKPPLGSLGSDLLALSQVSYRLRALKEREEKKPRAPPPRLSFG